MSTCVFFVISQYVRNNPWNGGVIWVKKTHSVPHSYPINPYQSTIHWVRPSPSRGRASCTAAALGGNAPVADAGGKLLWTSRQVVGGSWKLRYVTNEIGHVSVREKRNGVWVSLLYIYISYYIYICMYNILTRHVGIIYELPGSSKYCSFFVEWLGNRTMDRGSKMVISSALRVPGFFLGPIPILVENSVQEKSSSPSAICVFLKVLNPSTKMIYELSYKTSPAKERKHLRWSPKSLNSQGPAPAPSVVSSAASQGTSAPGPRSTSRCPVPRPPEAAPPCRNAGGPGTADDIDDLIKSIIP